MSQQPTFLYLLTKSKMVGLQLVTWFASSFQRPFLHIITARSHSANTIVILPEDGLRVFLPTRDQVSCRGSFGRRRNEDTSIVRKEEAAEVLAAGLCCDFSHARVAQSRQLIHIHLHMHLELPVEQARVVGEHANFHDLADQVAEKL